MSEAIRMLASASVVMRLWARVDQGRAYQVGVASPVGPLAANIEAGGAITGLDWCPAPMATEPLGAEFSRQMMAYFAGDLQRFDLPLRPAASAFQKRFYAALSAIPYGETRCYGEMAAELDVSAQAIGQACGANPIPVLIPCHRVLAAHNLGGFSGRGGVEAKVALLRLEGAASLLI